MNDPNIVELDTAYLQFLNIFDKDIWNLFKILFSKSIKIKINKKMTHSMYWYAPSSITIKGFWPPQMGAFKIEMEYVPDDCIFVNFPCYIFPRVMLNDYNVSSTFQHRNFVHAYQTIVNNSNNSRTAYSNQNILDIFPQRDMLTGTDYLSCHWNAPRSKTGPLKLDIFIYDTGDFHRVPTLLHYPCIIARSGNKDCRLSLEEKSMLESNRVFMEGSYNDVRPPLMDWDAFNQDNMIQHNEVQPPLMDWDAFNLYNMIQHNEVQPPLTEWGAFNQDNMIQNNEVQLPLMDWDEQRVLEKEDKRQEKFSEDQIKEIEKRMMDIRGEREERETVYPLYSD